jgi:hypothetical protein
VPPLEYPAVNQPTDKIKPSENQDRHRDHKTPNFINAEIPETAGNEQTDCKGR